MEAPAKVNNFVSRARQSAPEILEVLALADGLAEEWFANGYNGGGLNEITDEQLLGDNTAISATELQNLMYTLDTLKNTLDGAHRSNLQVARP